MQKPMIPARERSRNWSRIYAIVALNTVIIIFLLWLFSRVFSA